MKNLTLAMNAEVLDRVRKYAAGRGTTVNALVREHLERIATEEDKAARARERLVELSQQSPGRLSPGWKFDRASLYEDRLFPGQQHPDLRGFGEGDGGGEAKKGK